MAFRDKVYRSPENNPSAKNNIPKKCLDLIYRQLKEIIGEKSEKNSKKCKIMLDRQLVSG